MDENISRREPSGCVESLEDRVYRSRIAAAGVRKANPLITVPFTLLGYLVLGLIGWQFAKHARSAPAEGPSEVIVDLQEPGDGEPQSQPSAPAPAAASGPPPGAIVKPDVPPPSIPVDTPTAPDKPPEALPTRDLSGVAFPAQPPGGSEGTGTGAGPGTGGTGEGSGPGSGTGQGPRIIELEFSEAELLSKPEVSAANYPKLAYAARVQGTVSVELLVGTDGIPVSAHALEGPPMLRGGGEAIALKYRFKPELRNGVPVMARINVKVVYRIQ